MQRVVMSFLACSLVLSGLSGLGCGQAFRLASSDGGSNEASGDAPISVDTGDDVSSDGCSASTSCGTCDYFCGTKGSSCSQGMCTPTNIANGLNHPTGLALDGRGNVDVGVDGEAEDCASQGTVLAFAATGGGEPMIVGDHIDCATGGKLGAAILVDVNTSGVYWAGTNTMTIEYQAFAGGSGSIDFTSIGTITAFAVDDKYAYAVAAGVSIYSHALGAAAGKWNTIALNVGGETSGLAIGRNEHIAYWSDTCYGGTNCAMENPNGIIGLTSASSSDPGSFMSVVDDKGPAYIAVAAVGTGGYAAWIDMDGNIKTSQVAATTGTLSNTSTLSPAPTARPNHVAIAIDGTVAWTDQSGSVWVRRSGGSTIRVATGQADPEAIVMDGTSVYWVDSGPNGSVWSVSR
jgi:hypothetical protein